MVDIYLEKKLYTNLVYCEKSLRSAHKNEKEKWLRKYPVTNDNVHVHTLDCLKIQLRLYKYGKKD